MPVGDKFRFEFDGSVVEMVRIEPRRYDWSFRADGLGHPMERANLLVSVDGVECGYVRYSGGWSAYKLFEGYEDGRGVEKYWEGLGHDHLMKVHHRGPRGPNAKEEIARKFVEWRREGRALSAAEIEVAKADVAERQRLDAIEKAESQARYERERQERQAREFREWEESEARRQQTLEGLNDILRNYDGTLSNFERAALQTAIEHFSVEAPPPRR